MTTGRAMALSAVIAACATFLTLANISLKPPGVKARHLQVGAAAGHVLVDAPQSLLAEQDAIDVVLSTFTKRAELYGTLIPTPPVLDGVARRLGVSPDDIMAISRLTEGVQTAMREPDSEQRSSQLLAADRPLHLDVQADPDHPVINVYAQAPTAREAERLADAAVASLDDYLAARAAKAGVPVEDRVKLVPLGPARGGVVNGKTRPEIAVLTFLIVFGLALGGLLGAARVRRGWARVTVPVPRRGALQVVGDWPRTTRVLPWMLAGFLVVLWLVPFNVIQLTVSLPFDLKLDRLVLPAIFLIWLLALASDGPASPRMRLTLIHVGVLGFAAIACLGIVVNAHALNHSLEFELAVKKVTLLISYVMFFVIMASSVRRSEVPAFLRYTLALAVVCAIGVIWEYRFHYNAFYDISGRLLHGIFEVGAPTGGDIDDIGRHLTRGPADHPLEAVGMLTMALPIALVGVIHSKERRKRILYGVAACILMAAAVSTYRKSALLAPLSVCLTIAYFRRGDLLKLAPLGVIVLGAVHALSPGALGAIVFQLHPSRLGVSTVSDRASDYDAVRPDVWTHLLFGRGYGTYDHVAYRILDSEVLGRLVDTGVLGLLALWLMLGCVVVAARATIHARDPRWSPPALAIAAAAIAFLVLAFLFDVTSFPHDPYILMSLAGLLAVMVGQPVAPTAAPPPPARRGARRPLPEPPPPSGGIETREPVGAAPFAEVT